MHHAIVTSHLQSQGLPVKPLRYTISTLVKFTRTPIPIIPASSPSSPTSRNSELADSTRLPIQMARYGILFVSFSCGEPGGLVGYVLLSHIFGARSYQTRSYEGVSWASTGPIVSSKIHTTSLLGNFQVGFRRLGSLVFCAQWSYRGFAPKSYATPVINIPLCTCNVTLRIDAPSSQ